MMFYRFVLFFILPGMVTLRSLPASSPLLQRAPQSIGFLKMYGYLPGHSYDGKLDLRNSALEELFTKDAVENAIKEAQRFGGLKETGILDDDTVKLFSSKRCGVPDIIRNETFFAASISEDSDHHHHRKKRYVLNGPGWKKRHLKFAFRNWASTLSMGEVEQETEKALGIWAKYGHLKFTRTNDPNNADITFGFYTGHHGDTNPFDGKGNVLAHAYFPVPYAGRGLAGDVHFDDDETWSVGRSDGRYSNSVDYTTVALHELGHSLGLSHSHERGSVMNPYYKGTESLGEDDIRGMHELYASQPMEYPGQDVDERQNHDEERRRYDQHRREWEKRKEEERRKQEEEEREKVTEKRRKEEERKYEEEKRKYEEERRKHEERLREEAERRKVEEKQDEERRKRLEEESRRHEEERRALNERRVKEEERRYEENKRKQEATRRAEEERKKYEEDRRRKESNESKGENEPTTRPGRYPSGTTFEGDYETVDHHKEHDSTHQIPPKQGEQELQTDEGSASSKTNSFGDNDGCKGSFDAVAYLRGELFIIKGMKLWRLSRPGAVQNSYPTEFHRFFHLLPKEVKKIDAMYQRDRDESFVIFSGRQYWVFDGWKFIEGSPRPIQDYGLPAEVDRVDGATSKNRELFLFSGDRYWSLNDTISHGPLKRRVSQPISALKGLPGSLDAALTYNDVLYFFKGDRFWYQDQKSTAPALHHAPASDYWVAC